MGGKVVAHVVYWVSSVGSIQSHHSPTRPQTISVRGSLRGMKVVAELSQKPALLGLPVVFGLSSEEY